MVFQLSHLRVHGGINEILLNGKGGIIYHNGPSELAKEIKSFIIIIQY